MTKRINWIYLSWIILLVAVVLKIYIIFWQFNYYHLIVPPSPDLVAHVKMADIITAGGGWLSYGYPPLLHILVSKIGLLFHASNLDVFIKIAPYWLIIVIPIFYLLVYKLFNWQVAFWATIIYILVSNSPFLNFTDAQYPDILAYNIIAPFYILFFISAITTKKCWHLIIAFLIFALMLSAHHLSSVLLYLTSLISLIIYAIYNHLNNKEEYKRSITVLAVFIGVSFVFFLLAKLLFPGVVNTLLSTSFHLDVGKLDPTKVVLDYSNMSTLLSPFLEFIGFAGLIALMKKNEKCFFVNLFIIVWIIVCWVLSRSSIFVFPQRIFREIALPLSISAGYFVYVSITQISNKYSKILIIGLSAYLIVISSIQLFTPPFMLPDGYKDVSWYHEVDKEKFDDMSYSLPEGATILANYSNDVLLYKLGKAGFNIVPFSEKGEGLNTDQQKIDYMKKYVSDNNIDFIFIGVMPPNINPKVYFKQFLNYEKATDLLNKYPYKGKDIKMQFSDGSKLIKINNDQE